VGKRTDRRHRQIITSIRQANRETEPHTVLWGAQSRSFQSEERRGREVDGEGGS
jgi:hypothetical protein